MPERGCKEAVIADATDRLTWVEATTRVLRLPYLLMIPFDDFDESDPATSDFFLAGGAMWKGYESFDEAVRVKVLAKKPPLLIERAKCDVRGRLAELNLLRVCPELA